MKKMIALVLILVFAVCMLTACGGGETTTTAPADKPAATQAPAPAADSTSAAERVDLKQIKELEQKNIKLVDVYNEVAALTNKNGWNKDELTLKDLNACSAAIATFNSMIKDPSSAKGADMPEILSAVDDMIKELDTNIRARVSVPFSGQ